MYKSRGHAKYIVNQTRAVGITVENRCPAIASECPAVSRRSMIDPRSQAPVHEDTSLELDQLGVATVVFGELADVGGCPVMDRDLKWRANRQAGYKAGHDWHTSGAMGMKELV